MVGIEGEAKGPLVGTSRANVDLWKVVARSCAALASVAFLATLLSFSASIGLPGQASAQGANLTRVSTDASNLQLAGWSGAPSVANGGNLVVFASSAPGLPGSNGASQIYLKELSGANAGRVTLISGALSSPSVGGNGDSTNPVISADGGTIAFESAASNLIAGDNNGRWDIFSRRTGPSGSQGDVSLVSVGAAGQGDGNSRTPSISSGGQYISFWSDSQNIASHQNGATSGVYRATPAGSAIEVSDMRKATNGDPDDQGVSFVQWYNCPGVTPQNNQFFGGTRIGQHAVSDDGTVVFTATWCRFGLSTGSCVGTQDSTSLFAALPSGVNMMLASCEDSKLQIDHTPSGGTLDAGGDPAISPDGLAVVFATDQAKNSLAQYIGLSAPTGGGTSALPLSHNQFIHGLQVTSGAGLVSFSSTSTNLASHASSGRNNVYVVGGSVGLISETPGGTEANADSGPVAMTSDGQKIVFGSGASNLVAGDTNGSSDVFRVDTPTGLGNFRTATQPTSTDYWHLRDDEHFGCNRAEQYVADCHATAADPVDTATGNFHEDAVDFNIAGRGFPLKVTRSYNSLDTATEGAFGFGWTSNLDTRLVVEASGDVAVIQETGARTRFHPRGSIFENAPWNAATLNRTWPSGDYAFTQVNGDTYTFDSAGQLTRVADRNNYAMTFEYDANAKLQTIKERDAAGAETGRTLSVTWSGNHIGTITAPGTHTDPANAQSAPLSVTYGYTDGRNNLNSVTDVAGATWTFGYQDATNGHLLTNVRDPKQTSLNVTTKDVVNQYDVAGRVTTQTDNRGGRVTTFDYNATPISGSSTATKVTDPKGNIRIDYYDALKRRLFTKAGFGSPEVMTTAFTYDPSTFALATVVNSDTGKTLLTLTHDSAATDRLGPFRVIASSDALGHTTTWSNFDRYNQPGESRDPAGTITTFTYSADGKGNLTSVCRPVGTPTLQNPIRCTGAATDQITSFVLDSSNAAHPTDVIGVKDALHQDTSPTNAVRYGYDTYGYANSVTDPLGNTTTFVYDNVGRLLSSVAPKGNKSGGTPALYTTTYTVDAYGTATAITDPQGHVQQRHFNANHDLEWIRDANNKTTTYVLDDVGQIGTIQRPDGTNLVNTYNSDGTLWTQVDGAGHTTTYTYDHLGRPLTTKDPNTRVTTYTYDQAGRLWTRTNPAGVTTYTYDDAGELKTAVYGGGTTPNITDATYDNLGHRLTLQTTAMTSSWTWDNLGRLTSSNENNTTVGYRWNLDNTLRAIAYPGGDCDSATTRQCVTRHYDNAERLDQITDWNGKTTAFHADENNNYDTITFPTTSADVDVTSFDRADQVTGYTYRQGTTTAASIAYQRRADNSLSQSAWSGLPGTSPENYGYDNLNRLCYVAGTAGTNPTCATPPSGAKTYGYDTAADNLTRLSDGTSQVFDPANQLCYTVPAGTSPSGCLTPPSNATTYGYDNVGNRVTKNPSAGVSTLYTYDQENRLTSAAVPNAGAANGQYSTVSPPVDIANTATGLGGVPTGPLAAGGTITFSVVGVGGVPAANVTAVAVQITTTASTSGGCLYGFPSNGSMTGTSACYSSNGPLTNMAILKPGPDGKVKLTNYGFGQTQIRISTQGWYGPAVGAGSFTVIAGARIVDTRTGIGVATAQIPANGTLTIPVVGQGGIPNTGVAAATLNLTAINATQAGTLTAFPADQSAPGTYTVSYQASQLTSGLADVRVATSGTDIGKVKIKNAASAPVDLIVDVEGWTATGASPTGTGYSALANPVRAIDTRSLPAYDAGQSVTYQIGGTNGIPASGAVAIVADITVTGQTGLGWIDAQPAGATGVCATSDISYPNNQGATNLTVVPLSADGKLTITPCGFTKAQYIVDISGYYTLNGTTWTYTYNGADVRQTKTSPAGTTTFTWSYVDHNLLMEKAGSAKTYYLYGPDGLAFEQINPDGTTLWLHHDQLGSTRMVTNAAGTTAGSLTYDAYGNTTATSGTVSNIRLRFAGEYLDTETGLYYLRNRYYDPSTAQFLTRDPLVGATRSAYAYAGQDPLNAIDPAGLSVGPESWWDAEAQVANFAGGLLDSVTLGNGKRILNAVGQGDKVDACSGWFTAGERTGLVIQLAFAVAELKGATAAIDATEGGGNTVFRGLAEGEDPSLGLTARNPSAGNDVVSHIAGARDSQWISTTRSEAVARDVFGQNGYVRIDLSKVPAEVVDVSSGIPGMNPNYMLSRWAAKMQEVLVKGHIPPGAIG